MRLLKATLVALLLCASPVATAAADSLATSDATAVLVAKTGTVDAHGRAVVDLAVVCPVEGTIDGLAMTFEQHRRGQVTQGFTDLDSFAIPCSPDGVHMQLALEVFTNVPFGPGRIVVTESIACGVSGCATLASGQATVLHRTR